MPADISLARTLPQTIGAGGNILQNGVLHSTDSKIKGSNRKFGFHSIKKKYEKKNIYKGYSRTKMLPHARTAEAEE